MKRLLLLLLLCLPLGAAAQNANTLTLRFAGVPSGSCAVFMLGINNSNTDTYACNTAGAWVKIASGGGGGAVSSVFGRTGAVTATAGDYGLGLIGNPAAGTSFTYATNQHSAWVFSGTGSLDITGPLTVSGNVTPATLTASVPVFTDSSKNLISGSQTGTGTVAVVQNTPTLTTPIIGVASGTSLAVTSSLSAATYLSATKCAAAGTAASPSVAACSAAPSGSFSCATNASTATCTINTSAVTASSAIFVQPDSSLGSLLSVTCNTTADTGLVAPRVSARAAATSFTITLGTFTTNPLCFNYWVVN